MVALLGELAELSVVLLVVDRAELWVVRSAEAGVVRSAARSAEDPEAP